ncbi:unnamed protein product, partial (mitochondrion) [Lodderomyces beijingensis]
APWEHLICRDNTPYTLLPLVFNILYVYPVLSQFGLANNQPGCIADSKKFLWDVLPHRDKGKLGIAYDEDDKLDTRDPVIVCTTSLKQNTSASIYQKHIDMRADLYEVTGGRWGFYRINKASKHLSAILKTNKRVPGDLIASIAFSNMRGRSLRSMCTSARLNAQKGDRAKVTLNNNQVFDFNTWLQNQLSICQDNDGKYNGLINIISNPDFLLHSYKEIKSKSGNMTKGTDNETFDGIKMSWFSKTGSSLKSGKWDFKPMRMVEIPKSNGKMRPLKIASPRDKIVQKALQIILERIYEPRFSSSSHGFRPNRSTHSALNTLYLQGGNFNIAINGDITKCFDSIPHNIIMNILKETIKCHRTLELIHKSLKVISVFNGRKLKYTGLGTPQGSILSPLLANIVLDKFDKFMEQYISDFTRGDRRKQSLAYKSVVQRRYKSNDPVVRLKLLKQLRNMNSTNFYDPDFRRMIYTRYADDFVILIIGTYKEAYIIRDRVKEFIALYGLELNLDKTTIVNTREGFKFLGASCFRASHPVYTKYSTGITRRNHRRLIVNADLKEIISRFKKNKFVRQNKLGAILATSRRDLVNLSHFTIISFYNNKIQGLLSYYSFAGNYSSIRRVIWLLVMSCALTLTLKYKLRYAATTFRKFGKLLTDPSTDIELKIPREMKVKHKYNNNISTTLNPENIMSGTLHKQLTVTSDFDKGCVLCGSSTELEMHHIRQVKDVRVKMRTGKSTYAQWVGAHLRKQVPLCAFHHKEYHAGNLSVFELKTIASFNK